MATPKAVKAPKKAAAKAPNKDRARLDTMRKICKLLEDTMATRNAPKDQRPHYHRVHAGFFTDMTGMYDEIKALS